MVIRKYMEKDLPEIIRIWNEVVEEGVAFPQEQLVLDCLKKVRNWGSECFNSMLL